MKYFSMFGNIDTEMFTKFAEFYNQHQDEEITIVIDSKGGNLLVSRTVTEMINRLNDVTIIIQGVFSAAFEVVYNTKCKKILCSGALGMWHYGHRDVNLADNNKLNYYEDECHVRNLKVHKRSSDKIAKAVMTKKELKKFGKNKDVFFDFKRMRQIFPHAQILK